MSVFVGIHDPEEVRRDLLLSSKAAISSLRRTEEYAQVRKQKLVAFQELNNEWAEMLKLMRRLKAALPKDVRVPTQSVLPVQKAQPQTVAKKPEKKSKLDVLDDQLAKIESRLAGLQ